MVVAAVASLEDREQHDTGQLEVFVGCEVVDGQGHAAADGGTARWCQLPQLSEFLPGGLYRPVQYYLEPEI